MQSTNFCNRKNQLPPEFFKHFNFERFLELIEIIPDQELSSSEIKYIIQYFVVPLSLDEKKLSAWINTNFYNHPQLMLQIAEKNILTVKMKSDLLMKAFALGYEKLIFLLIKTTNTKSISPTIATNPQFYLRGVLNLISTNENMDLAAELFKYPLFQRPDVQYAILAEVIKKGNFSTLNSLVKIGYNAKTLNEKGENLFFQPIIEGKKEDIRKVLQYLHALGLNPSLSNKTEKITPLDQYLQEYQLSYSSFIYDPFILHTACEFFCSHTNDRKKLTALLPLAAHYPETLNLLLDLGADPNQNFPETLLSTLIKKTYFPNFFSDYPYGKPIIKSLDILIKHGAKIEKTLVVEAISRGSKDLIEILSPILKILNFNELEKINIWEKAIERQDTQILDALTKIPSINLSKTKKNILALIFRSIGIGSEKMLMWIYSQTPKEYFQFEEEEILAIKNYFYQSGNLSLFDKWHSIQHADLPQIAFVGSSPKPFNEKFLDMVFKDIFQPLIHFEGRDISHILPQIEEELTWFFLFSDVDIVSSLIQHLKKKIPGNQAIIEKLTSIDDSFGDWGALIARQGSITFQNSLTSTYHINSENQNENFLQKKKEFLNRQKLFGQEAFQQVEKACQLIRETPSTSLKELFSQFANWRSKIALSQGDFLASEKCKKFRVKANEIASTPFKFVNAENRYNMAVPIAEDLFTQNLISEEIEYNKSSNTSYPVSYVLKYKSLENDKTFSLTRVSFFQFNFNLLKDKYSAGWVWEHTNSADVKALWEDLEKIHKDIVEAKTDSAESKAKLKNLIAKGYWLGANIMLSERSNAQYMLMTMAVWYRLHQHCSPIPKIEVSMPDCFALTTPESLFILKFESLFARPPLKIQPKLKD